MGHANVRCALVGSCQVLWAAQPVPSGGCWVRVGGVLRGVGCKQCTSGAVGCKGQRMFWRIGCHPQPKLLLFPHTTHQTAALSLNTWTSIWDPPPPSGGRPFVGKMTTGGRLVCDLFYHCLPVLCAVYLWCWLQCPLPHSLLCLWAAYQCQTQRVCRSNHPQNLSNVRILCIAPVVGWGSGNQAPLPPGPVDLGFFKILGA